MGWVAHEVLVSAQGPLVLGFGFLALELWGLGPGLDNICFRKCNGTITDHDSHDILFGGRKVYLACLGLWVVSLMVLLPDIMGVRFRRIIKKSSI